MKAKSIILLLLFAVSATGCGIYDISYGFGYEQLARIERGMNLKEVCDILGEPILRDLNDGGEIWGFRAHGTAGWTIVRVWFKDGKVTEMKSYLEDTYPATYSKEGNGLNVKKNTSDTNIGSKIVFGSDGKLYIDMGSIVVAPDGKQYIKTGSMVVTSDGTIMLP